MRKYLSSFPLIELMIYINLIFRDDKIMGTLIQVIFKLFFVRLLLNKVVN